MASPLVSILTPSFNQGRWLGDNLRSVASQTYDNVEQIVMDGSSTDDSVAILRGQAGPHVRWWSEPDRGQSHALNKALAESRGEIIGWVNSDDAYFDTGAVAAAVELFQRRPEVDVIYGHAALVNGEGLVLQLVWTPPFSYGLLRRHNFIIQPAAFIRKSALGDWIADEAYASAMDRELWLRLGKEHRFAHANRILAVDRHHRGRKSLARPDLARSDGVRLVRTYGVPAGAVHRAELKLLKVAFRIAGLALLPALPKKLAFDGGVDGRLSLALRQVARRRAAMPAEDGM